MIRDEKPDGVGENAWVRLRLFVEVGHAFLQIFVRQRLLVRCRLQQTSGRAVLEIRVQRFVGQDALPANDVKVLANV